MKNRIVSTAILTKVASQGAVICREETSAVRHTVEISVCGMQRQ